jgi:hypothetical protein
MESARWMMDAVLQVQVDLIIQPWREKFYLPWSIKKATVNYLGFVPLLSGFSTDLMHIEFLLDDLTASEESGFWVTKIIACTF